MNELTTRSGKIRMNNFRKQINELLLQDADGEPLEIVSGLLVSGKGEKAFLVANKKTGEKWNHYVRTELTESDHPYFPKALPAEAAEPDFTFCQNCQIVTGITINFRCGTCGENICLSCGCTDSHACPDICDWARPGMCTSCDEGAGLKQ